MSYEFKVEDVEYVRHGDTPQLARLYRPQGAGPFPIMVELHGGAWCRQDRLADKVIHESLAKSGVIVASLDFRQPPAAPYPASFQDIHYGIRWLKSRAAELGSRPDMIGSMGNSSGGHQAMLLAMRAFDSRYGALPQPAGSTFDATVRAVIMCSPVIDPIGRYRYAKDIEAKGKPYPLAVDELIPCHDEYWQTEAAMDEGSPAAALEKGERVQLPPVLYLQGRKTSRIRGRTSIASWRPIARPAAWSISSCSRARARASSCARPARRRPIARSSSSTSSRTSRSARRRHDHSRGDSSQFLADGGRRGRRRAVRVHAGPGAGLQLEALPGQGAVPAPDQASLHRRAREEHSRVRVAVGHEGQVGDAAGDPGPAEDDRRDDGQLGRHRRLLHLAARREEALLEGRLVPPAQQVPRRRRR